jgi:hypothetical protein
MARARRPPKMRLSPQLSSEAIMLTAAIRPTAPRPVVGTRARRSMSLCAGGEVATT